jgi:hypothetical protein
VHKDVGLVVIAMDETVAVLHVEPLDSAGDTTSNHLLLGSLAFWLLAVSHDVSISRWTV